MIYGRCAACKSQRRRCPPDCIFSPYFPANDPQRFEYVHRIYGGSNVGKMLQQLPCYVREQAANTLYVEAQCRIQDPVYGCVGIISKLYQQIHDTEVELAKIQTQIASHKIKNSQVESNFNILSTIDAESNLNFLPPQSNNMEFQLSSQIFNWFS
ncbi:LOB domain-containing protein 23-like [Cicer arietinum]|uniref:LOB domain-containing protein 24-like n=1 Tax=Cicer arietinum TaxID=3827 RepID=A0A1S2YCI0_CICAR|nr:LOB domain-containing protein 24-like [Cicer arietinum]